MSDITILQPYVNVMAQCSCGQVLWFSETKDVVRCPGCDKLYKMVYEIVDDLELEEK